MFWRRCAVLVVVAISLVACGDDASDSERAADRLDEALAAHAEGELDDARTAYEEVLELEPGNQFAHYNLGLISQGAGEEDDAEASYRRALETDPGMASALFNLAILRTEADPDEAEQLYRSVISVEPDNASAHLNLGFLLLERGEEIEGQAELEQAVELDPSLATRIPEEEGETEAPLEEPAPTTVP